MFVDNHVHSTFSCDADNTVEEMCSRALDIGLPGICFTEHIDVISEKKIHPLQLRNLTLLLDITDSASLW